MKNSEILDDKLVKANLKKWESPRLLAWNTEESLDSNPIKFLINVDRTLDS